MSNTSLVNTYNKSLAFIRPGLEIFSPFMDKFTKPYLHGLLQDMIYKDLIAKYKMNESSARDISNLEYNKLPKAFVFDLYTLFNVPTLYMGVKKPAESYKKIAKMLMNRFPNTYTKTITVNNNLNSFIVVKNILLNILVQMQNKGGAPNSSGSKEEDKADAVSDMLQKILQDNPDLLKQATAEAVQEITEMESKHDLVQGVENDTDKKSGKGKGKGASKSPSEMTMGEIKDYLEVQRLVRTIQLDMEVLNSFVKKSLELSTAYFSPIYKLEEESILDADTIEGLENLEYLHPGFKNIFLDEITTNRKHYFMKFNIYVDISSSMRGAQENLAKASVLKLSQMKVIDTLIPFGSSVYNPINPRDILKTDFNSGTSLNRMLEDLKSRNRPSIILTDCCDYLTHYSELAYFIGLDGANFNSFPREYVNNRQLVYYQNGQFLLYK